MRNRFSLILFFYYAQFCILFSFSAVFFREQGYSEGMIGQLAAISGLAVLAANPAAGRLADRVGEKKVSALCLAVSAVLAAGLYAVRKEAAGMFLFFGLLSVFDKAVIPLLDNWLYRCAQDEGQVNYGKTRAIGSLGGAICAAGTGLLIDAAGFRAVFGVCIMLLLVTAALTLRASAGTWTPAAENPPAAGIRMLLTNKKYLVLLVTSALLFLGVTTEVTYYPVLFLECGGNNRLLGLSLFLMSCSEMTGMSLYMRFRKKLPARYLLLMALISYTVKIALQIIIGSVPGLMALQLLQGVTYGLFMPSIVELVSELVPAELSATGMGLCAACFNGVGVVLGNWLASIACERFGLRSAYRLATVFCVAAVLLYSRGMLRRDSLG